MLLFPRETSPPGLFCSNSNETHVRALSSWRQDPAPPASPHLRRRWVYNSSQGSVNYNPASCLPLFLFSSFRLGLLARSPRLSTAESLYLFPRKPRLVCFPLASFFLFALIEPLVNPGTWKPEKHGPESHLFTSCFPVFPISCLVFFFREFFFASFVLCFVCVSRRCWDAAYLALLSASGEIECLLQKVSQVARGKREKIKKNKAASCTRALARCASTLFRMRAFLPRSPAPPVFVSATIVKKRVSAARCQEKESFQECAAQDENVPGEGRCLSK